MNFQNIIFVGPQKTGTSLIYEYLKNIPVSITFPKETFYFQLNNKITMEQYLLKFKSLSTYLVEISPSYFSSKKALLNIKSILPDAHIIISIRKPESLIVSYLYHLYSIGRISSRELNGEELPKRINLDSISYDKYILEWVNNFNKVSLFSFENFSKSYSYRLDLFKSIFDEINEEDLDLEELPISNEAFSYNPLISPLRQLTPYLNVAPFSNNLIYLKEKLVSYFKRNKDLPSINKNMKSINRYIELQNNFFSVNENFEKNINRFL